MLENLYFEEGKFAQWQKHIEFKFINGVVHYTYGGFAYGNIFPVRSGVIKNISQFQQSVNEINVNSWNNEYLAPVLDGHCWTLKYKERQKDTKEVHGVNAYPLKYRELVKLVYSVLQ